MNEQKRSGHDSDKLNVHIYLPECWGDIFREIHADFKGYFKRIEKFMSQLSEKIDAVDASLDRAVERIQSDVKDFNTKIADLEAKVASGTATPEENAKLEALQAKIDAIDPTKPDVLPPE